MTRATAIRAGRAALAVVLVGLACWSLATQWDRVSDRLGDVTPAGVAASVLAVLAALWCSMLAWRGLLADLGSPLPTGAAAGVFFPAQLAKYVPGSIWPALAQAELGTRHAVPRRSSAAATGALLLVTPLTGGIVAAGLTPFVSSDAARRYWPVLLAVPVGLVLLHPPVFAAVVNRALRLVRRPPLDQPLSRRGMLTATGWMLAAWLLYGLHVWALARDLGATGPRALVACIAGFALAWTAGFLVLVVPAGAGVRDVALTVVLTTAFDGTAAERTAAAAGVAVLSRLLMSVADLACAAGGALMNAQGRRPPADGENAAAGGFGVE